MSNNNAVRLVEIMRELAAELGCDEHDSVVRQASGLMLSGEPLQAGVVAGDLPVAEHVLLVKELSSIADQLVQLQALRPKPFVLKVVYAESSYCPRCKRETKKPYVPQSRRPSEPKQLPKPELPSGDMLRPKEFTR
jgi:hypothetical protein